MSYNTSFAKRLVLPLLTLSVLQAGQLARAQQPQKPPADDVLRVNTELVQTAVTVIDKQGHFVDGLTRDQFGVAVDGQPRSISFFERVTAGSPREAQLTAAPDLSSLAAKPPAPAPTARSRSIVFFIDDMHMSPDSLHRTRDMLRHFLSAEMSSADSVVIASSSGQIGFLEQFTNNSQVLTAAIERLSPKQYEVRGYGSGSTRMREYDALIIDTNDSKKANSEILNYYIRECVTQTSSPKTIPVAMRAIAATCETQTRNSARAVLMQAASITQNMYASLETLMHSMSRGPGRKLVFFISDGFLMNDGPHAADLRGKLDTIIDTARRSGVVAYTIDSRGLINNDVDLRQGSARPDFGAPLGEIEAQQDAMNALAEDTGGRALRNMNYFDRWVGDVLDETSNYYLVAWRPELDAEKLAKFRSVIIRIVNRPELTVRAPRGYVAGPNTAAIASAGAAKTPANHAVSTADSALRDALSDFVPSYGLPTTLSLAFLNTPKNEMLLTSSIQVATGALDYGSERKQPASIKLAGVILNDKGKIAGSFKNQLNVNPIDDASGAGGVIYNDRSTLAPGIYQVRVAARDERNGRVGSAMQWIVIPNLATHQLMTSSLLLGGQVLEKQSSTETTAQVQLSVDHQFARSSRLGYWIFAYNAKRDPGGKPNLVVQSQVIRNGRIVLSGQPRTIHDAGSDPDRIAFGDQLLLNSLTAGRYDLRVTVTDGIAGTTAVQTVYFDVQ
ncbi:MAG: VWA domain-containing protein [Pyrinomonadaceae bacterium]